MNLTKRSGRTAAGDVPTGIDEIIGALSTVARVFNQSKAHTTLCRRAGVDLDRGGAALLYKLHVEGDDVHFTVLAERLGIDSPAVTRKVQQLERAGLVRRERDAKDARALRILLTEEGRDAIERLLAARREWLADVLSSWSAEERLELAQLLGRFALSISGSEASDVG